MTPYFETKCRVLRFESAKIHLRILTQSSETI
jgi:hypothetical protein